VTLPNLPAPIAEALAARSYTDLTPVQTAVMVPEAEGRDLLVSAQTGSGKTVAFGIAMASDVLNGQEKLTRAGDPLALIIAPTRELALQVQRELEWLYSKTGARVISCVGGMDPRREARNLADGCHIVVGTPGRLRDHLERGRLEIGALKAIVLDEADEMLDLGFREDLEFILGATPEGRRSLLFSATLPPEIVSLAKRFQRDALRIATAKAQAGHSDIDYRVVRVAPNEIEHAVVNVLRYFEAPCSIVFCNTREAVRHLQTILHERGFTTVALSGELSQNERNHALQALRDGRARVCVATDVAARGIDLPNLDLVVHAELPRDAEVLQHRSGRTGRAGRKGVSVLLVPFSRRRRADQLLQYARVQAQWSGPPTAEEIRKLDQERLLKHPCLTAENTEEDLALAQALLAERAPEELAAALARFYREQLPAPEELYQPPEQDARPPRERTDRPDRGDRADRSDRADRGERPERGERPASMAGRSVWFRINVGRQKNADPRWLLPLICRVGKVTKPEIGSIRIFERDTRFEVAIDSAERFTAALARSEKTDVKIEAVGDAPPPRPRAEGTKPGFHPKKGIWKAKPAADGGAGEEERAPRKPRKKRD
jgi:ATP-dependent RNA helicase DeaD